MIVVGEGGVIVASELSISPSVKELLEHRHDHYDRYEIPKRDEYYREAFDEYNEEPVIIKYARGFERTLAKKKILIEEYDILAGFHYRYTYDMAMPLKSRTDWDPKYRPVTSGDYDREIKDCINVLGEQLTEKDKEKLHIFKDGVYGKMYKHWESGHIIPGYERLIKKGYGGLIEEGRDALKKAEGKHRKYIEAMLICNCAAAEHILRYVPLAETLAEQTVSQKYKKNLARMAESLKRIAYGSAESFYDAVQLIWLTVDMLYSENYPASFSFGRIDRYLYPYYKKDIEEGKLTKEEASEIIDAFFIKFSTNLHTYQNMTIGGWDHKNNKTEYNELTILFMQSARKLKFEQPLICLRYDEKISEEEWNECVELVKTGTGFPAFFSDKNCTVNVMRMGIPEEDAHEFGLIGCVEMGVPGKEYAKTEVLRVNWPKVIELMLSGGKSFGSKNLFPLSEKHDLDTIECFDEFYKWYVKELLYYSQLAIDSINMLDKALVACYPTPFLSVLMEGCYKNGMDVTGGGTIYNHTGIDTCGMATAVDSLMAIKRLVFDKKQYTLNDFADACANNFNGYSRLMTDIKSCPKFGNDEGESEELMAELIGIYDEFVRKQTNPRGGRWQLGLYTVEDHSVLGTGIGATPDGRLAGTAVSNGFSPVQGRDKNGPTAVINSLLRTDMKTATNGMVLDLKFNKEFLDKKVHTDALKSVVDTYFRRGGIEVQFNVVDRETLIDAQQHPERHEDLVVRVSGFSALFVSLIKRLRTKS